MLLLSRMKACEMQVPNSYRQHVSACKHIYINKSFRITFAERLSMSVSICVVKKHM